MISAEILQELREWAVGFGFNKFEIYGLFVLALSFYRLPDILKYRAEMRAIDLDFKRKSRALEAKIEKERSRRKKS